jgi:uncharacterized glyoxalase superfamily protein PhnB
MKLNAVGVTSTNLKKTTQFYSLLGFQFPKFGADEQHVESIPQKGEAKLMIDHQAMIKEILGETPQPGNHSSFAVQYDSANELDEVFQKAKAAGFKVVKAPWDAFWGQRYAILEDPDGYKVDLYAQL